jgi:RNA 2',3'-cyclic 3'-phosphodiesterase
VRLFVAVNLPDSVRRAIEDASAALRQAAPSVRWLQPDNFHITLKFLGSVADERITAVRAAMEAAAHSPQFAMTVRGAGAFPNFRRPRVYWVGVDDDNSLARLQLEVERTIAPLGFPTEARPFHPHITIGRVNEVPAPELRAVETASNDFHYESKVLVKSIELMESKLSPKGARYEAIQSVALGAKP